MDKAMDRRRRGAAIGVRAWDSAGLDPVAIFDGQIEALLAQRRYAEAEPLLREAIRLRPDDPHLLNKLGSALWEQGWPAKAEPLFVRAIELAPENAVFLNNLGLARWDQGRAVEAAECYRRALELDPRANHVRMNLGVVLSDLGRFDEALPHLVEAARLDPRSADSLQNLGMTLARMGRWREAMGLYEEALRLAPEYAEVRRNRGYGWLTLGDFERGWPEHEWRLRCRRHAGCRINRPLWQGEALDGRAIVLHAEQGFGDTLQFIRYAAIARQLGGVVFVATQTPLIKIIARCPGVDMALDGTSITPDCDVHAPLMSLPAILRTTLDTVPNRVPYLPTEPIVVERWRERLAAAIGVDPLASRGAWRHPAADRNGRPFLVGVAWQGSPKNPMDRFRSFPLAEVAPVADVPGVRLVCIQSVDGLDQIPALGGRFPVLQLDGKRPRDFRDTAALISLMDLVIAPDSAVTHLAGGLGVPIWLALSTVGEWRWMLEREDSPWYPTMRIFRQTRYGEWGFVFRRMAEVLHQALGSRPASAA